jgi:hypothetical protein
MHTTVSDCAWGEGGFNMSLEWYVCPRPHNLLIFDIGLLFR